MRLYNIITLLIIWPITLLGQSSFGFKNQSSDNEIDVLFIGSSYFGFNNLPLIFENLCSGMGQNVYIDSRIPGGWFLDDHANSEETEMLINQRSWNFVILQGGGNIAYPSYYSAHPVFPALVALKEKILLNYPNTKIIYCMPWAFEDGMTWIGWEDKYADMQEIIYDTTMSYSDQIGFSIAPVGWAWYEVLDSLNYPLHYLHLSDWSHPSERGSYLMGCVIYASVFLESVENNPYYLSLPEQEALWFQHVASDMVLDNLELWNLADSVPNGVSYPMVSSNLINVYPNPAERFTTIEYHISKPGIAKTTVINTQGKTLKVLNNRYFATGTYKKVIDLSDLLEGVYFIVVEHNQQYYSQKIIL